mgnify:CR=1 FL=1
MNNGFVHWLRRGLLILLLFIGPSLQADIVYPARLQLTETSPGVYEVFFVLPVIQGKILRAQAVFPEFCSAYSEPVTEVDSYQKKMRWQIGCGENTLAGQQIGIDGLLGSQVDIILEVNTLDGRIYESKLSPARAYYTIPEAPVFKDYVQIGTFPAGRFVLLQWGLVLLVLLYFLIFRNPDFRPLLITLSGGLALGFFLDHNEWLLVPSWAATTLPLGAAAVISLFSFVKKQSHNQTIAKTLIGICGVLAGAGFMEEGTPGGYTSAESGILLGFSCLGFLLGTWILLVTGGPPTPGKPTVELDVPSDPDRVSAQIIFRVADCQATYEMLVSRGADLLAPPNVRPGETRAFFRDPDGHLFEISELT